MGDIAGKKHDAGKLRYDLVPVDAEAMVVQVLTFGAEKYGAENWRDVPDAHRRYYAAARRHLEAHRAGHVVDDESHQHHLAHAICCLVFMLQMDIEREKTLDALPTSLQRQAS